jgi:hypothetical protein
MVRSSNAVQNHASAPKQAGSFLSEARAALTDDLRDHSVRLNVSLARSPRRCEEKCRLRGWRSRGYRGQFTAWIRSHVLHFFCLGEAWYEIRMTAIGHEISLERVIADT